MFLPVQDHMAKSFGVGLVQIAFFESNLIKYVSAIEDLLHSRVKPQFRDVSARNIPVLPVYKDFMKSPKKLYCYPTAFKFFIYMRSRRDFFLSV